jgi:NAD(P)-dependent dehydrogenase (short-subunit alcohol dehydrogenase family)
MKRFVAAVALSAGLMLAGAANAATVFITGSNKGLGFEFAKQYAEKGWTVIATTRSPDSAKELKDLAAAHKNITIEKLDVSKDDEIKAIAAKYKGKPIDLVINNAGVLGEHADQTLGTFSRKGFHDVVDVNDFGALAVSEALRENVIASQGKKIVAITSGLGSIAGAGRMPKAPYYYRMSKAALNMGFQALNADLKGQGVTVGVVAPGTAETTMLTEFLDDYSMKLPSITATESVSKMIGIIDGLDQTKVVKGINNYDGTIMRC